MAVENQIYYRLIGMGAAAGWPLVFIHGILGFWRNFYSISQAFKRNHTSLLYDQRGHGQSFHKEPYTVRQLAQDLKDLLDFLKWSPVILVGHSLGGYVACLLAYYYPQYVKKMIIVDSSPWPLAQPREQIEDLLLKLPNSFPDRAQARIFFKQSVENNVFSQAIANLLMANLEKNPKSHLKFLFDTQGLLKLLNNVRALDYPSLIKALEIPILVLRGERSTHFLRSDFEKTLKLNSCINGKEIKDSGHWLHFEQPQSFIKALTEFLD